MSQGAATARRTAGLELALRDNTTMELHSLDLRDTRVVAVKVASPPALVIAKLIKLAERMSGAKPDRILAKDASDVLRILRYNDAAAIGEALRTFGNAGLGSGTIEPQSTSCAHNLRRGLHP